MVDDTLVFPAGKAIQFSEGEYSDYSLVQAVVTLVECDLKDLERRFKARDVEGKPLFGLYSPETFVSWLVTHGYVFPAEIQEVHIGSYGELEVSKE